MSTKGQIVIPEKFRRDLEVGSTFVVTKIDEMIVLKPISGLDQKEVEELKELNSIWNNIDKADKYSEKEFFNAMKQ